MSLRLYTYSGCSTCRAATKWLRAQGIPFTELPIRETPPTLAELRAMLAAKGGELRALFNTAGGDYRELGLKDKLASMTQEDALSLLASRGNLIKRPFALDEARGIALTGFKDWDSADFPQG